MKTALSTLALVLAAGDPRDRGATGLFQALLKLQTTASALHVTAHPDDENGGVLASLSRGQGVWVGLLTLNRGEAGDNAIGPELFDALGLIRTEELLVANRFYGVDAQYFTRAADYGFSKRQGEAFEKWGHDDVLRDVVHVVRVARPLVLISRFRGEARDGHGQHQAAGVLAREAFDAAGDPNRFPEQIAAGLRPWRPLKLYVAGARESESWSVRVDTSAYSPWLGDSYLNLARAGLAFQRSQNSGAVSPSPFLAPSFFELTRGAGALKETTFFDAIDVSIEGIFDALGRPAPDGAAPLLQAIAREARAALDAFSMTRPEATAVPLVSGLRATRAAIDAFGAEPDAQFLLRVKERQFQEALQRALGIEIEALTDPPDRAPVVPGETFTVAASAIHRSRSAMALALDLVAPQGSRVDRGKIDETALPQGMLLRQSFSVTLADGAPISEPHFSRASIRENRYATREAVPFYLPAARPAFSVRAGFRVDGVALELEAPVRRRQSTPPYGTELHELSVLPVLAVQPTTRSLVVPAGRDKTFAVDVELLHHAARPTQGQVSLALPPGWMASPAAHSFVLSRPGGRVTKGFAVSAPTVEPREYTLRASATAEGNVYARGVQVVRHRDLETRYLFHDAVVFVRGVDLTMSPGLHVGYVMGIGDEVPKAIAQLGARVSLLESSDLASGDLRSFDTVVTGTRAYAVRADLNTHNRRLLDYVREGGNLIVLYNTPELVPNEHSPYPGELPRNAEEVTEEDALVEILEPENPALLWPNRIAAADFDGWIEQRGSKFWSRWDPAYTAVVASHDKDQSPQRGGWLHARYGKGHYTYFAYALHRQLPFGVPGAYRLLANLLALGKNERAGR